MAGNLSQYRQVCIDIFEACVSSFVNNIAKEWRQFVRTQLHKGGGLLFRYIAKDDKRVFNVDLSQFPGLHVDPNGVFGITSYEMGYLVESHSSASG